MAPADARGFALARERLTSFDRQFSADVRVQRPDRYRLLDALPADQSRIARGGGVSYVAASFGNDATTLDMRAFDRLLAFDVRTGLLCVEAGASIGDVQRFLLPRGWYLPVAPGHPRATIGGCIAADVHGKNPARDGTFRALVEELQLHVPGRGLLSLDAQRDAALFEATIGGLGITGTITRATLRLARPPRAIALRRMPVDDLAQAARVLRESANAHVLYGWHDGRPDRFGRGVIRVGLSDDEAASRDVALSKNTDLPATIAPLPVPLWNRNGIAVANSWLSRRWCKPGFEPIALAQALFPLNDARLYFAGYGKTGLVELQWLVPHPRFEAFAAALGDCVARERPRIALISSKLFDGVARGFALDGKGIALALHLPSPTQSSQRAFCERVAELAIEHGGRPNPIKDSTLDETVMRRAFADFGATRDALVSHNRDGRFGSELTRRIGL
jgi:decaprenylphospho-beta-D-ribofuranose 2-oxidase